MPKHSPAAIVAALRLEGIECSEHDLGLAAYAPDPCRYARMLRKLAPATAAAVTPTPAARPICHGYANCCSCPACETRSRGGAARARPSPRQPWEPRPPARR